MGQRLDFEGWGIPGDYAGEIATVIVVWGIVAEQKQATVHMLRL